MNILFFIGNGFDINLGLKTRYTDFYPYYKSLSSKSDNIKLLKENISDDFKNWSDLELAIGEYTENFNTVDDFIEVYEDVGDNLADYLNEQEESFPFEKVDLEKLSEHLAFPEKALLPADSNEITKFKEIWNSQSWFVNVISFNYTKSLEKILSDGFEKNLQIGLHNRYSIVLKSIQHIHGFCNDRMIMGVNDESQIRNQSFHSSEQLFDALVKPNCNKAHKHTIDDLCASQIKEAQLICVFGSSIGDTDNHWWHLIGEQLKKNCRLIIFTKGEEISRRWGYKKAQKEREMKDFFLNKTNLTDDEKTSFRSKIFVGVNTDLFSNLIDRQ